MKVAVIADTHAGARNNSRAILAHQIRFFQEIFFPEVKRRGIDHMYHLGDSFDIQTSTSTLILKEWKENVFDEMACTFDECYFLIGNHDSYYKTSLDVNTPREIFSTYENFSVIDHPHVSVDGKFLFLPWICDDNRQLSYELLGDLTPRIVLGHLEIMGFVQQRGLVNKDRGLSLSKYANHKLVLSGHFHYKSNIDNAHYVGSPYHMRWSDYPDPRGFHILDLDTLELEFIPNPYSPFLYIKLGPETKYFDFDAKDKFVKIEVGEEVDSATLASFIQGINDQNPASVPSIVHDLSDIDLEISEESIQKMDLLTISREYISQAHSDNSTVHKVFEEVYLEALREIKATKDKF